MWSVDEVAGSSRPSDEEATETKELVAPADVQSPSTNVDEPQVDEALLNGSRALLVSVFSLVCLLNVCPRLSFRSSLCCHLTTSVCTRPEAPKIRRPSTLFCAALRHFL